MRWGNVCMLYIFPIALGRARALRVVALRAASTAWVAGAMSIQVLDRLFCREIQKVRNVIVQTFMQSNIIYTYVHCEMFLRKEMKFM